MSLSGIFAQEFASTFEHLAEGHDDDAIVGFGVHSDADATGLVFAAQSRRDREHQLAAYPDYPGDAVWSIGDWDIHLPAEALGTGPEGRTNEAVAAVSEELGNDLAAHRDRVWGAAVDAMAALHQRGFFDRWPGSVRVFLVMDGSNAEQEVYDWHARFNNEDALRTLPVFLGLENEESRDSVTESDPV